MANNKKPRKAYKPKAVATNPLAYMSRMKPERVQTDLIEFRSALESILKGIATIRDCDTVTAALNGAAVLCLQHGWMEYYDTAVKGQSAQTSMTNRVKAGGKILYTGLEMTAVKEAMDVFEAQLPLMTPMEMNSAAHLVSQQLVARNFTKSL